MQASSCCLCGKPISSDQPSGEWEGHLAHRDCIEMEEVAEAIEETQPA